MSSNKPELHKKQVLRAAGAPRLVGFPWEGDIDEESIIDQSLWKPYRTNEKSITEKKRTAPRRAPSKRRSRLLDIKISSADLDQAFLPPRFDDTGGFQTIAFDPMLQHAQSPLNYEAPERNDESTVNEAHQAMGDGYIVRTIRGERIPRRKTPFWIKTLLVKFILDRVPEVNRSRKRIPRWARLDFVILDDYYMNGLSDLEIFDNWKRWLKKEIKGSKWTSSANAVKVRRIRLIKLGNKTFGEDIVEDFHPNPDRRPEHRHLDVGIGGYIYNCAVNGCPNRGETSEPITGEYICEVHPPSIQLKTAQQPQQTRILRRAS